MPQERSESVSRSATTSMWTMSSRVRRRRPPASNAGTPSPRSADAVPATSVFPSPTSPGRAARLPGGTLASEHRRFGLAGGLARTRRTPPAPGGARNDREGIGLVRIRRFHEQTPAQAAVRSLQEGGAAALALDLRGSRGAGEGCEAGAEAAAVFMDGRGRPGSSAETARERRPRSHRSGRRRTPSSPARSPPSSTRHGVPGRSPGRRAGFPRRDRSGGVSALRAARAGRS